MVDALPAALSVALILGLGAAVSPGPLTTLVVGETLRHGPRAGILVAISPLLTDLHALIAGIWLVGHYHDVDLFIGIIALMGAAFLLSLGISGLRVAPFDLGAGTDPAGPRNAFRKGLMTNALNPNLYIFWFTVGATTYHTSLATGGIQAAAIFLIGFYLFFIGAKMLLAVLVGRSRTWVTGQRYVWTNRTLAVLLIVFATMFAWDGATRLL